MIDDFSDDPSFSRHSKLLHSLFTRGRHNSISTIVSTQKNTAVAQIIRVNATFLCVYRLRNNKDLECLLEEVSGTVGRKELLEMYDLGTKEPYSFLYINLVSPNINNMFLLISIKDYRYQIDNKYLFNKDTYYQLITEK